MRQIWKKRAENLFLNLLFLFCLSNLDVVGQTIVPAGSVSGSWNASGSPYLIQGSVIIPDGQTLTIAPGVNVIFQGSYQMFVQGRILAEGAVGDSITFTASNQTNGWLGVRFDNTPLTNDSSKFNFCKVLYGINLNVLSNGNGGGLYINNFPKISLKNSLFQFCKTSCASCNGSNGNGGALYSNSVITISNSVFKNNQATTGGNGGAICVLASNSKIVNCKIQNNSAFKHGGIWSQGTIIDNCIISNNSSGEEVGGVSISGSNSKIINSTVSNNSAGRYGGGIVCSGGLIINNTISNNTTGWYGGGISGSGTITNNLIENNTSTGTSGDHGGGGVSLDGSSIFRNNTIRFNTCQKNGGGILSKGGTIKGIINNQIYNNSAATGGGIHFGGNFGSSADSLIGNVIANNTATSGGAIGITSNNSAPKIWNNTIVNNSATNGGAFYAPTNNSPEFKNCIIYGNTATQNGNQFYLSDQASQPPVYNSNVQGGSAGFFTNGNFYLALYQNNLNSNPLFVSPSSGSGNAISAVNANWRLQASSPCIDAGVAIGSNPAFDLANSSRTQGLSIDMGAYEYLIPSPFDISATTTTVCAGQPTTLSVQSITGTITALNCASSTNTGTLTAGTAASGVSSSVPYTVGNGGLHNGQTVTSTGITGLTAILTSGTFAVGAGSLTYTITGTPSAGGTASFALNIGGQTCILSRTVALPIGTIATLSCGTATNTGVLTSGAVASGVSSSVPYTGGNGGTHNGQTVTSTGVTGLTATLMAGTFAVGSGSLTYTISGTPSASGTASFALNIGGQTCTLTRTVNLPVGSITVLSCGTATNTGTLTSGTAASGVSSSVPYTGGNGGTYNGQTVNSTGVTGLTATLTAGTFASGAGSLTYIITGTPSTGGTASFALNIGGQVCTLTWVINYGIVTNPSTGRIWLDRNLGASQVATSIADINSFGDLYQWGRRTDGHQSRASNTTTTTSSVDQPTHSDFIRSLAIPQDWRIPQNNNLWQGLSGTNNPCPSGFRLPTDAEWNTEKLTWSNQNSAGAFASVLKLPVAGYRLTNDGSLLDVGTWGNYWSSTVNSTNARYLYFGSTSATIGSSVRANGASVRCIKN